MKTFVCTFPEGASTPNIVGIQMSVKERIRQVVHGVRGAFVDEDFTSGPDHIMQVRCTSTEAALFMKLALANIAIVHVTELRGMIQTDTWSQLT
ncbi:MAG TPA: hypothetical protein VNW52_04035 [Burkholderiaceae bacterium]|jgi:hypothetical protein|nr:hypothetical protein [Burkholderiaceae bacterium]